jgi:hypothetical protein
MSPRKLCPSVAPCAGGSIASTTQSDRSMTAKSGIVAESCWSRASLCHMTEGQLAGPGAQIKSDIPVDIP